MAQETIAGEAEILETLREVLSAFEVDGQTVSPASDFEGLGLDSLDLVELSVRVEDRYAIEIEEDDLKEVTTVGDAVALVRRKLGAN